MSSGRPEAPPFGAVAVGMVGAVLLLVRPWFEPRLPVGALVEVVEEGAAPRVRFAEPDDEPCACRVPGGFVAASDPLLLGCVVDLNRSGVEALVALPEIGPALGARIVADRARRGPFYRVDDLDRVSGIGPATLAAVGPWVGVGEVGDPPPPAPVDLNRANAEALGALPGVGPTLAARILADRAARGPFGSVADADRVRGIGPKTIARWGDRAVARP